MAPKKRIAAKPSKAKVDAAKADEWINASDDPEAAPAPKPEKQDKAPSYPHRISFDVTTEMHKALKIRGIEESRAMNEILREAVQAYLNK